jgi:hypothetical protein
LILNGVVAAGGADEFLDAPTGLVLNPVRDGQRGDHDRQVGLYRVAGAVVDGLCRGSGYADDADVGAARGFSAALDVGIVVE